MNFQSKLPNVGTTIFTTMSELALQHKAINLGQGFPDFNPDPELISLVHEAMLKGHNQYPAMPGVPALREQISLKVSQLYGHSYNPETEITITSGATEALMCSILALVKTDEEVIVIEPVYDLYIPAIELAGGIPVVVPMLAPDAQHNSYRVDWQRVRNAITNKTRMLILNFPHNPTGIILDEQDLDILETIVADTGIFILSDEVYEHIIFGKASHCSMAKRVGLIERSIIVSSFGKTYHVTGWKLGYCLAAASVMQEIRKVHQFTVFTVYSPMQYAMAQFLKNPAPYLGLSDFYQAKRDYLANGLNLSKFKPLLSQGTFFLLADYSQISTEPEALFAKRLTIEHGVTAIPMSAFYQNPDAPESNHQLVRLCFAKDNATLDSASERLKIL